MSGRLKQLTKLRENEMERLPRNTEMFAPNVSCVVVLNYVLKPEILPFKQPRDFLLEHIFLGER